MDQLRKLFLISFRRRSADSVVALSYFANLEHRNHTLRATSFVLRFQDNQRLIKTPINRCA